MATHENNVFSLSCWAKSLETNHGNQVLPGGLTGVTAAELLPEEGKVTRV